MFLPFDFMLLICKGGADERTRQAESGVDEASGDERNLPKKATDKGSIYSFFFFESNMFNP